jgi:hypothetical protein
VTPASVSSLTKTQLRSSGCGVTYGVRLVIFTAVLLFHTANGRGMGYHIHCAPIPICALAVILLHPAQRTRSPGSAMLTGGGT